MLLGLNGGLKVLRNPSRRIVNPNPIDDSSSVVAYNSRYQDLLNANPYRNADSDYYKSPWQNFLSVLGFRTQADAYRENMAIQAKEYDAQIAQKQYDEQYNSPVEQVARMRNAGLNPDIDGGSSVDSGSAQNLGEDPSTPMQSTGEEQQLMDFANGVMSIFTTSLGLATSVQGFVKNRLQNNLLGIQNETSMADFAMSMFPFMLPETDNPTEAGDTWYSQALTNAQIFAGTLPKRMQSKFVNQVRAFWNSAPGEKTAFDAWKQRVSSKKDYALESSTFYNHETDQVLSVLTDELSKLNERLIKSGLRSDIASNENNAEYMANLDSALQAQTENAQNEFNKTNFDMNQILNESLGSMIDRLDQASKKDGVGGGLASIAMALLASFRLMITTQGLPSVSRSSGQGQTKESFKLSW